MIKHISIFSICILLLAACGQNKPVNEYDGKTVFRYNEIGGITSLDPAAANKTENIWAVNQLFNGLVQLNDKLEVLPCIAKSWEIYDDGMEYTFHLRTDVFFHDDACFENGKGRKLTAQDFYHTFYRLFEMSGEQSSKYLAKLLDRTERTNFMGFEAADDSTFKIYLAKPFPAFLEVLSMQFFCAIPHEAIELYAEDFGRHPVGTGPFKFKIWSEQKLVLTKNENYFEYDSDKRLPHLDAVSISFIKDKETAFTNFMKKEFDMISGFESVNKDLILDKNGDLNEGHKNLFVLQTSPYLKTDYLGFLVDDKLKNVKDSPLRYKEVRQAINYAIDRDKIVTYLRYGIGIGANSGFVPEGLPSHNKNIVKGYTFNPDKARELIAKAGYGQGGKPMPVIELNITTQFKEISENIKKQLEDVGFKITININPMATQSEKIATAQFNFFRKSWVGDYADAQNFLSIFYSKNFSPNGPNYFHFYNEEFDKLYEQALTEQNDSVRYATYQRLDNIVMDEAPVVPLYYDEVFRLVQTNVEGLTTNPMNLLNLKRVMLKQ
jgi:peptide/nickel transport system substrate-binding protein